MTPHGWRPVLFGGNRGIVQRGTMDQTCETDNRYESCRAAVERAFQVRFVSWWRSLNNEAAATQIQSVLPADIVNTAANRAWEEAAGSQRTALSSKQLKARVPDRFVIELIWMCVDFFKTDTGAYLQLLRRKRVPGSDWFAAIEKHTKPLIEDLRRRKWQYAIDQVPAVFDGVEICASWNCIDQEVDDYLKNGVNFDTWFSANQLFAQRLQNLKDECCLSFDTLADEVGVSRRQLCTIAAGKAEPSEKTRCALSDYFTKELHRKFSLNLEPESPGTVA